MDPSISSLDYLKAFLGGVGVSFTPCVYPLLPITVGFIGASSAGSRLKGFFLSLAFVTGVAVTYSALGLLASLTGTFFGEFSSKPVTHIIVGVLMVLFSLSMFDIFTMPSLHKSLPVFRKKNYFSAFILGMASGLIISPCLSPVLATILLFIATKKSVLYGTTLLLSFAYGLGAILILAGTFSSILLSFPKSGKWLTYVKKTGGVVILGMGLFFIISGLRRMF